VILARAALGRQWRRGLWISNRRSLCCCLRKGEALQSSAADRVFPLPFPNHARVNGPAHTLPVPGGAQPAYIPRGKTVVVPARAVKQSPCLTIVNRPIPMAECSPKLHSTPVEPGRPAHGPPTNV